MFTLKINVENLIYNAIFLRQKTQARFCAVLKANAYGHGFEIAQFLSCVDSFAVACGEEAIKLRKFTSKPIYVLCPSQDIGDENVIYCAMSENDLRHKRICVKINTGMNRLGVLPQQANAFLDKCSRNNVVVDSVYTHLSDCKNATKQLGVFDQVKTSLKRHALASNFLQFEQKYHYDMVRSGLALYGYGYSELKPVLSAFATVYNVVSVKKGERVGYAVSADKDMKIAVLGVGYADSIRRQRQNFYIGGKVCHTVGNVCMDMCLVDVSGANVKIGDSAEYLGSHISGESVAKSNKTIVYDILTSLGGRCRRIYE